MYKYIFNFVLFYLLFFTDIFFSTDSNVILAVNPALIMAAVQFGGSALQKMNAASDLQNFETQLGIAKDKLDDIEFTNKLEAMQVPKNISGMQSIERAETATVDALKEAGQRGVANIPKAVQATNEAMLNVTEQDRKAQFLSDKAVREQSQLIDTMNTQKELQQQYQEIMGLQQAGKEARQADAQANQAMLNALVVGGGQFAQNYNKSRGLGGNNTNTYNPFSTNMAPATIGNTSGATGGAFGGAGILNPSLTGFGATGTATNPLIGGGILKSPGTFNLGGAGLGLGTTRGFVSGLQQQQIPGTNLLYTPNNAFQVATLGQTPNQPTRKQYPIQFDLSSYGITDLGYDSSGWGDASPAFASGEYVPGQDPQLDEWFSIFSDWHEGKYGSRPDPNDLAGRGAFGDIISQFEVDTGIRR